MMSFELSIMGRKPGASGPCGSNTGTVSARPRSTVMRMIDIEEIDELHDELLECDVVEGPPELKELVEEFWPELLHKLKPPREQMH